jgi:hypothetical protein
LEPEGGGVFTQRRKGAKKCNLRFASFCATQNDFGGFAIQVDLVKHTVPFRLVLPCKSAGNSQFRNLTAKYAKRHEG